MGNDFTDRLKRCSNDLFPRPGDNRSAVQSQQEVKNRLLQLIEETDDHLNDSPESFRAATIARGLKDPVVFNDLAELYSDQDNETQTFAVLEESLNARGGFAPVVLLQMGRIFQKQQKLNDAVAVLERAVSQLTALGFSESAGDFSTEELKDLRARAKSAI